MIIKVFVTGGTFDKEYNEIKLLIPHQSMIIKVFVTGGTFDKEYNEINGELFFKDTHLNEMLRLGRSQATVEVRTIMMVDSLSI